MNQDLKDVIYKAISDITPEHVDEKIKEDITRIAIKIIECVDGESTLGTFISLHILEEVFRGLLMERSQKIFGANSSFEKFMQSILSESIH